MSEISILEVNFESEELDCSKPKIYADAIGGYLRDGSRVIELPELYLTAEDYDRIYKEVIAEFKEEE